MTPPHPRQPSDEEVIEGRLATLEGNIVRSIERAVTTCVSSLTRELHTPPERSRIDKVWDIASKIAVPVVMGMASFLYALDNRVQHIEDTRMTAAEFTERLHQLEKVVTSAADGPSWMRNDFIAMAVKIDALKEQIAKLSERVVRIESTIK